MGEALPAHSNNENGIGHELGKELNGAATSGDSILYRYREEREKRIRADGMDQYLDHATHAEFKHFQEDPWVVEETPNPRLDHLKSGNEFRVLTVGAGFGGLLFAARLLRAGF